MKNYYEVLQVNKTADKEIIQKVYKILTKKYHPDLQQNDEEREYAEKAMAKINEAYDVISDDEKRKEYDYELEQEEQRKLEKEIRKYIDKLNNSYSEVNMSNQIQNANQANTQTNTSSNQSYNNNNNTNYTPGYSRYVTYGSSNRSNKKKKKKIVATIMDIVVSFCILVGILFLLFLIRQFMSVINII